MARRSKPAALTVIGMVEEVARLERAAHALEDEADDEQAVRGGDDEWPTDLFRQAGKLREEAQALVRAINARSLLPASACAGLKIEIQEVGHGKA